MTALSADRHPIRRDGVLYSYPAAASVTAYLGGIAVLDSSGNCKPGVTATGLVAVGVFAKQVDNSSGAATDVDFDVQPGIFRMLNSAAGDEITKAEIGDRCYIVDDQTVAKTDGTGTRSVAGQIVDVDSAGVWVRIGHDIASTTGLLAANNLSDLGTAATARANLGGGADVIIVDLGEISLVGGDATVRRFVAPVAGDIKYIRSVTNGALTTGNATITAAIGGTPVTAGVVTITQAGSAAGDVDLATPSAANTVAIGDVVSLTVGGTNDAAVTASLIVEITPSA